MQDPVTIRDLDYVVFETGYTGRVIDKLANEFLINTDDALRINTSFIQCKRNEAKVLKLFNKRTIIEYATEFLQSLVLISNGDEFVELNDSPLTSESSSVSKMRGIIGCACEDISQAMRLFETLRLLNYCACLDISTLLSMRYETIEGFKVLIMDFDTESG